MSFPDDFVWGAATASYQIEGSPMAHGGGESIWDMFCRREGKTFEGDTGDLACDHYNRYRDDVRIMQQMGLQAYRFSVSWPRVMPSGAVCVNAKGLDFYDKLVDELLDAGIQPWATLFHWEFPYDLYLRGGWLNPDSSHWFADYAAVVVDKLSDRVKHWMTLNEPQCIIRNGHEIGIHAPGDHLGMREIMVASHNILLAHGRAVLATRAAAKAACKIGFAPVAVVYMPETESEYDIRAARERMFASDRHFTWNNSWWMDPIFKGHYPEDGVTALGSDAPRARAGDMDVISQPLDFAGANLYHGIAVRAGERFGGEELKSPQGAGRTMYHWTVTPRAMYWGTRFLYERYKLPIVVTENGMASPDWVALDGRIHDAARIDFINRYLLELKRACSEGILVKGYFHWSLMDNFEWNEGYKLRFGLTHVDFETMERTLKDSAYWYRRVIETNGASLTTQSAANHSQPETLRHSERPKSHSVLLQPTA